jgi:hypothetical protein
VKRFLLPCILLLLAACGDDDDLFRDRARFVSDAAPAATPPHEHEKGVCAIDECPTPDMGTACCTPLAQCGFDPTGLGLNCVPNPGDPSGRVCVLSECPEPTVGNACCTAYAQCGIDPFGTGEFCFSTPPIDRTDAGVEEPTCDLATCPQGDGGPVACCLDNGDCGSDTLGIGICYPAGEEEDAGVPAPMTTPPDDPSVDGQCPSYIDDTGPIWGCCSAYGVCGTFVYDQCFLAVGTEIPVGPASDEDAGVEDSIMRCKAPKK